MIRNFLFILSLIQMSFSLSLPLTANAAPKKTAEDYWNETRLTFKDLGLVIHTKACYLSPAAFSACFGALEYVLHSTQPNSSLIAWPASLASNAAWKLIQTFESFAVAESTLPKAKAAEPGTETSLRQTWLKVQAERKIKDDALQALFTQTVTQPIDFKNILDYLADTLQGHADLPFITAQAINLFNMAAIDPHTHINPFQQINDEMTSESEQYFGVGIMLQLLANKVMVQNPMDGSPALQAGIRAHDILLEADGIPLTGLSLEEVTKKIRGPSGTPVLLTIQRKEQILKFKVIRAPIDQPNVSSKILRDLKTPLGYIRLTSFMSQSGCAQIHLAIKTLEKQGAQGLILDLRNNPGGLLSQGVCMGGLFVGNQVIVKIKNLDSDQFTTQEGQGPPATHLPMITLINANSASASEILAGALQDYKRSWIVGDRSFGKATVQGPKSFSPDGRKVFDDIAIFRTQQRFYQPSGRTNQVVGISPDFPIDIKPNATEEDRFALREADLYSNALPSLGSTWTQPRPKKIAQMQHCVTLVGQASQIYAARQDDAITPDFQLLSAEDLLVCDINRGGGK